MVVSVIEVHLYWPSGQCHVFSHTYEKCLQCLWIWYLVASCLRRHGSHCYLRMPYYQSKSGWLVLFKPCEKKDVLKKTAKLLNFFWNIVQQGIGKIFPFWELPSILLKIFCKICDKMHAIKRASPAPWSLPFTGGVQGLLDFRGFLSKKSPSWGSNM